MYCIYVRKSAHFLIVYDVKEYIFKTRLTIKRTNAAAVLYPALIQGDWNVVMFNFIPCTAFLCFPVTINLHVLNQSGPTIIFIYKSDIVLNVA